MNPTTARPIAIIQRIETLFDTIRAARETQSKARLDLSNIEENAIQEHIEEYTSAKNNDVRKALLSGWIAEADGYIEAKKTITAIDAELELLELEKTRLRYLIDALYLVDEDDYPHYFTPAPEQGIAS